MSGRGKKRAFDFSAVEHVGNDADIGGFLGNTEAEEERTTERLPVPSPAGERVLTAEQPAAEEPAAEEPAAEQPAAEQPAAEQPAAEEPAAEEPARRRRPQARDQGVRFTSISSDPPILRTKAKKTKLKPGQAAVVNSFLDQRTRRNWVSWSGRLVPDTESALKDRAYEDAEASGRRLLSASHYFDAAIKSLPEDSDEVERLATDWLIDRWDGEHPKGENAQFTISPEAQERLTELKKSLRGTRHGIWIDVLSAAGDCLLDLLQDEGPMPGS
ncbi:hypothetical protein ACFXKW_28380 [Streptomyces sp. NPDC059193]|uniref:hypothetical protein n=1 Tax=Streptomyces sp. NPDC059193 TaxID=3346763 RepID=UPI003679CCCD